MPAVSKCPTLYRIEFGQVGDTCPVSDLTIPEDDPAEFQRAVARHAIPHLAPVLAEMGHPEYADCLFRTNRDRTVGEFMWLDLAGAIGATFCWARLTANPAPALPGPGAVADQPTPKENQ